MKADESKSNSLAFGTKTSTWKDIGVDLCAKKGGWRWVWGASSGTKFSYNETGVRKPLGMLPVDWNFESLI